MLTSKYGIMNPTARRTLKVRCQGLLFLMNAILEVQLWRSDSNSTKTWTLVVLFLQYRTTNIHICTSATHSFSPFWNLNKFGHRQNFSCSEHELERFWWGFAKIWHLVLDWRVHSSHKPYRFYQKSRFSFVFNMSTSPRVTVSSGSHIRGLGSERSRSRARIMFPEPTTSGSDTGNPTQFGEVENAHTTSPKYVACFDHISPLLWPHL